MGLKKGKFCLKQFMHGRHCVHVMSLPVSAMATMVVGGVPIEMFMRYSPGVDVNGAWNLDE